MREVKLGRGRGQQLFRDDDRVRRHTPRVRRAAQGDEQAARHVFDVGTAFAQVVVFDLFIDGEQAVGGDAHGPFGVGAFAADVSFNFVEQLAVFEHEQVRVEDVGVLRAEREFGALLDAEQLPAR